MADNYYPDFDFPYSEATPSTESSTNSPIDIRLGQVPDIEDENIYNSFLEVYNSLQILQTALGNLTAATGALATNDIIEVDNNYSVTTLNRAPITVIVDASSNNVTVTLPLLSSDLKGRKLIVKRTDSNYSNVVDVVGSGGEFIDGGQVYVGYNQSYTLQANTANWSVVSNALSVAGFVVTTSSNYSVSRLDDTVLASAAGGNRTISLFSSSVFIGKRVTIKRTDTVTANTLTISSGSIDVLVGEAYTLQATSSGWVVVSNAVDITQLQADLTELIDVTLPAMQAEIDANTSAIGTINTELDAIDLVLIDFEARIHALENP